MSRSAGQSTANARRGRIGRRRIIVVGGGISGLAAAILLARRGDQVKVLERDVRPTVETPEEAFRSWQRPGVPQFRHSHVFLARLTAILCERFPEVLSLLRMRGALEIPLTVAIPPGLDLGPREKGDGELVLLGSRRAAFEWALLEVARREPGIEIEEGVYVEGLDLAPARNGHGRRVQGVRLRRLGAAGAGEASGIPWYPRAAVAPAGRQPSTSIRARRVPADLVLDASGRRSRAREWLAAHGVAPPSERAVPTGIFYFTRFYRLTGRRPPGASTGLVAGDVGWLKLATFPGDNDTFSITAGASSDDRPLRALVEPEAFEALLLAFPQIAPWRARGVSEPIEGPSTPVLVMGGLENRSRRFVTAQAPLIEGFFPIGDAAYHSNPIYGRGVTSALLSAVLLDDVLGEHAGDLHRAAVEFDRRARSEIEPYWESAARGDRLQQVLAAAAREGALEQLWSWLTDPGRAASRFLGQAIALYFDRGLVPASRKDGHVYRAVMRVMNMLDDPRDGLLAPSVVTRVLPQLAQSLLAPEAHPFPGPTRGQALALIERTLRKGRSSQARERSQRKRAADRPTPLEAGSPVSGHA